MNRLFRFDNDIDRNLRVVRFRPSDVLVVGSAGAGKSSIINALFERKVAKAGRNCAPETMHIGSIK